MSFNCMGCSKDINEENWIQCIKGCLAGVCSIECAEKHKSKYNKIRVYNDLFVCLNHAHLDLCSECNQLEKRDNLYRCDDCKCLLCEECRYNIDIVNDTLFDVNLCDECRRRYDLCQDCGAMYYKKLLKPCVKCRYRMCRNCLHEKQCKKGHTYYNCGWCDGDKKCSKCKRNERRLRDRKGVVNKK